MNGTDSFGNFGALSVFCGASGFAAKHADNAGHIAAIENFGRLLAHHKITLIWGAGETGMMGAVSRATLDAGGKAIGVSTRHLLYGREGCQMGVTLLLVADDMQARKLAFGKLSSGFVIFPGGAGTADELYEYLIEREYGEHQKPLVVVNLGGYYDPLLQDIRQAVAQGDITQEVADHVIVVPTENDVLPALEQYFRKCPDQPAIPQAVNIDAIRRFFADSIVLGAPGPDGAHTVTLSDTMIPLNYVGPSKLLKSVGVWAGGCDSGIKAADRREYLDDLTRLIDTMGAQGYRIVHSGQNTGMKGLITRRVKEKGYFGVGVATAYIRGKGMVEDGQRHVLIRRNEQSLDFTLKALSSGFVICPGGVDAREKLFEFLTEVDIHEHDKPLVLWNYRGYYDTLLGYLHHMFRRGYMNERAFGKVKVVSTIDEILDHLQHNLRLP